MNSVLGVTLPFFALIGCGYLAARRNFLSDDGVKGLNTFVFYFALPCLIFLALAHRPFADIVNWNYMVSYGLAGLLIFARQQVWRPSYISILISDVLTLAHCCTTGSAKRRFRIQL